MLNTHTRNYPEIKPRHQQRTGKLPKQPQKVLIVEDDSIMVKLLSFALEKKGYKVSVAKDGYKALDYLDKSEEPNLVLLDLMLPYHNGYEILGEIRNKDVWKEIPVIVMTAEARRKNITEAFDAGANDYLVKPIHFDDLLVRVKSFTETY